MGSGFAKKKKQMREFQDQMQKMQDEMQNLEVTGNASNLVEVTLRGDHSVKRVKISPECVDKEAVDALEDLVHSAIEDALKKLEQKTKPDMNPLGGLGF